MKQLLTHDQADIICLQETHIRKTEERFLKGLFKGVIFHAPTPTMSKGVLIGISNKLAWGNKTFIKDKNGHYVLLKVK